MFTNYDSISYLFSEICADFCEELKFNRILECLPKDIEKDSDLAAFKEFCLIKHEYYRHRCMACFDMCEHAFNVELADFDEFLNCPNYYKVNFEFDINQVLIDLKDLGLVPFGLDPDDPPF